MVILVLLHLGLRVVEVLVMDGEFLIWRSEFLAREATCSWRTRTSFASILVVDMSETLSETSVFFWKKVVAIKPSHLSLPTLDFQDNHTICLLFQW